MNRFLASKGLWLCAGAMVLLTLSEVWAGDCSCALPNKVCTASCNAQIACCACGTRSSQCRCCPSGGACSARTDGFNGVSSCAIIVVPPQSVIHPPLPTQAPHRQPQQLGIMVAD